jgi:membrane protein
MTEMSTMSAIVDSFDGYQRRHRWVGLPLAVIYKFVDDQGSYLAALITYYGFVSLFPLLLLAVTILGYVLAGDTTTQQAVLTSALRDFPVIGDQIGANVHSLHGSVVALVVGVVVSLYGGLGVTQAALNAMNQMWAIPVAERPGLPAAYGRGLMVLGVLALAVLTTTALSALSTVTASVSGAATGAVAGLDVVLRVLPVLLAVATNIALFLLGFRLLTVAPGVGTRQLVPGAVAAAVCWQVLQVLGTYLISHELRGMSASYGLFGIVLGLLAWIYLAVLVVLFCAEVNTVRALGMYPRSLLSVVPDDPNVTRGDRRAFRAYATTRRQKTYQSVDVHFAPGETESPAEQTGPLPPVKGPVDLD